MAVILGQCSSFKIWRIAYLFWCLLAWNSWYSWCFKKIIMEDEITIQLPFQSQITRDSLPVNKGFHFKLYTEESCQKECYMFDQVTGLGKFPKLSCVIFIGLNTIREMGSHSEENLLYLIIRKYVYSCGSGESLKPWLVYQCWESLVPMVCSVAIHISPCLHRIFPVEDDLLGCLVDLEQLILLLSSKMAMVSSKKTLVRHLLLRERVPLK